jgi:ribose 5-phosphate isomerase A
VTRDELKRIAAEAAARRVESGQRIGLGTGSTARMFLEALGRRIEAGEVRDVAGVPTSTRTLEAARGTGIPLVTLEEVAELDLAVDGADEVDPSLDLIKGLGGALLREKVVAAASRRFLVIVDEGKLVSRLGERSPVPVEVLSFGWRTTAATIASRGAEVVRRESRGEPYRTDQENYVLDCRFGLLSDPAALARMLEGIPGVLAHGLFLGMAHEVIVGTPEGPRTRTRGSAPKG